MEYVIYHSASKMFMRLNAKAKAEWVPELGMAHRFSSRNKVDNFMRTNFRCAVSGEISAEVVDVMSWDDAIRQGATSEMTEGQATQYLDALPDMISQMYNTGNVMRALLAYYGGQISAADKAQEDLLHKIEFTNADVVGGYRMYKDLQAIRLRRRQCKDICDMLNIIHKSGTVASLINLKTNMESYYTHLENRTYTPRILTDLFHTISSADISKVLGGVQNTESEEVINEST